mmetsp:Transcript_35108/g.113092  ORF Transcript_35108/g.113092 Transcript_35108/m.113092 type:complete len:339 (+) Transcript_35108:273-1289(+)
MAPGATAACLIRAVPVPQRCQPPPSNGIACRGVHVSQLSREAERWHEWWRAHVWRGRPYCMRRYCGRVALGWERRRRRGLAPLRQQADDWLLLRLCGRSQPCRRRRRRRERRHSPWGNTMLHHHRLQQVRRQHRHGRQHPVVRRHQAVKPRRQHAERRHHPHRHAIAPARVHAAESRLRPCHAAPGGVRTSRVRGIHRGSWLVHAVRPRAADHGLCGPSSPYLVHRRKRCHRRRLRPAWGWGRHRRLSRGRRGRGWGRVGLRFSDAAARRRRCAAARRSHLRCRRLRFQRRRVPIARGTAGPDRLWGLGSCTRCHLGQVLLRRGCRFGGRRNVITLRP